MHPTRKSTITLFVVGVILFILAPSGQANSYWKGGPSWLGDIGWYGGMICLLLLIASGVYWVVSRMRHRDRPSTS